MELSKYPRPASDNGRGIHWFPSAQQATGLIDAFVAELAEMHMRWAVVVGGLDPPFVNDYLVRSLVATGIMPIMAFAPPETAPLSQRELGRLRTIVHHYVGLGVPYFQLYYEPNRRAAWKEGKLPEDAVARSLEAWLPAAAAVVEGEGLPGLFPLAPGGEYPGGDLRFLQEALARLVEEAPQEILDRMWLAIHNYTRGHPPDERAGDSQCFLKFLWYDQLVQQNLGRSLPILSTAGGPRAGPPPLGDGVSQEMAADWTVWCYAHLLEEAPDYYFCLCPWLLGSALGGGDPRWEAAAWFRRDGSHQPVVEAVKAMPAGPRAPGERRPPQERFFPETRAWVREPFIGYLGVAGVKVAGLPLTEAVLEEGRLVQYFENLVLEEYGPGQVRPKALGREALSLKEEKAPTDGKAHFPAPPMVALFKPSLSIAQQGRTARHREKPLEILLHQRRIRPGTRSWAELLEARRDAHFFLTPEGTIYQLAPWEEPLAAGERGQRRAVEVALAGTVTRAGRAQLESLAKLLLWLTDRLGVDAEEIREGSELGQGKGRVPKVAAWREILFGQMRGELERMRRFFPETGFTVKGAFLSFLEAQGLELTGYPVSEVREEGLPTQYFQHLVLEEYQLGKVRPKDIDEKLLPRQELPAPPPPVPEEPEPQDLTEELPRHPRLRYETRELEDIQGIAIHHSGTSEPLTPEAVAEHHIKELGWPGIGYHFYIAPDGECFQTNALDVISFHAGEWNRASLGVCLAGDFHRNPPSQEQLAAAEVLCARLLAELKLGEEAVKGHGDLVPSDCPGRTWFRKRGWQAALRRGIRRRLAAGQKSRQ